jgi:hypothetical protein
LERMGFLSSKHDEFYEVRVGCQWSSRKPPGWRITKTTAMMGSLQALAVPLSQSLFFSPILDLTTHLSQQIPIPNQSIRRANQWGPALPWTQAM